MTNTKLQHKIHQKFVEIFQKEPHFFEAPGRINLIGEHTDYNQGYVLPAAIDKKIVFALSENDENKFRFYSIDFQEYQAFSSLQLDESSKLWSKYLIGVLAQFQEKGLPLNGFDCVFGGDIPVGAGLSSSAALECGLAVGINELSDFQISSFELVKMAQKAEHEYAGVLCGIMDQYASIFGLKDHVFLLDCKNNRHKYFPFKLDDYILVLVNTNVNHSLASSEYNQRRLECERGVKYFHQLDSCVLSLRDVKIKMIKENENKPDALTYKRCQYIVEENNRVQKATQALTSQNFQEFGQLMYESHHGLQHLYEVSCDELDFLVDQTREMDEVIGSRMMGGGFGGCTLNLVKRSFSTEFEDIIKKRYFEKFNTQADVYMVNIDKGAGMLA